MVIVIIYLEEMHIKQNTQSFFSQSGIHSQTSMVNVFGDSEYTDTISSKLIYFVKGDGGGGDVVALQGDRGHTGARVL